ncbi:MAG: hypothetical protein IKX23_04250 [Treponema sp.]|nr:hypothetical protein [Treponema sp.]
MKTIRKITLSLLAISSVLFTGCPFLQFNGGENWGEKKTELIEFDDEGAQFFVQKNYSNSTVGAEYTGYVSNKRQAAEDMPDLKIKVPDYGRKECDFIINSRKEAFDSISRASANDLIDITGINDLSTENIGDKHDFYFISDANKYTFEKASFTKKAEGSDCVVWFYENQPTITALYGQTAYNLNTQPTLNAEGKIVYSQSIFRENFYTTLQFQTIAAIFDNLIEKEEAVFGSHKHTRKFKGNINPQEKIDIIICDLFNDARTDAAGGVFGYFFNTDYINTENYGNQKSNMRQCIYVDTYWLQMWTKSLYSTLAHEFCHLLNFSNKTMNYGVGFDTWFTEMLAMTAEDYLSTDLGTTSYEGPEGRLNYFNAYYNYGYTKWLSGDNVYISYANSYAFGAYLARNFGGKNLIKAIATNQYADFAAIDDALKNHAKFNTSKMKIDSIDFMTDFQYPYYEWADWNFSEINIDAFIRKNKTDLNIDLEPSSFNTLNKSVTGFKAIDLSTILTTTYKNDQNETVPYYGPIIYNYQYKADLGPRGFLVHYFGKKVKAFNYSYYENAPVYPLFY